MHIINVLRGSEAEKILNYNHHHCKTFGAGRDWSVKQWQDLVGQLLSQDLLNKSDDYGVLSLSQGSYELLSGKRPFQGHLLQGEIRGGLRRGGPKNHMSTAIVGSKFPF